MGKTCCRPHFAIPEPIPLDIPRPDPNDDEDMEVPDQQALLYAFMAGLANISGLGYS